MSSTTSIPVANRVHNFTYAIRNIVAEARAVESRGLKVDYLNIGDPIPFGFKTPPALVEVVVRAMTDGANNYVPSPASRRHARRSRRNGASAGFPSIPTGCSITAGTSEGIELALTALANPGDGVLVPMPTYPLYTAVLAKIGADAAYYRTDPARGWLPDVEHLESLITPRTRALVLIDPNNPTGAVYPESVRRQLLRSPIAMGSSSWPTRSTAIWPMTARCRRWVRSIPTAPSSRSRASPRRTSRLDGEPGGSRWAGALGSTTCLAAMKKLADGRLCSNGPTSRPSRRPCSATARIRSRSGRRSASARS